MPTPGASCSCLISRRKCRSGSVAAAAVQRRARYLPYRTV
ncbi:hypothetical protein [Azospirillum melinis]